MKYVGLVWSNLGRKKLRTILTLLSIAVAFILFGLLSAIKEAFLAGVTLAGADRLIVRHKVSLIQPLPVSYEERIAQVPGVDAVVHATWFGGIYQDDPKNFIGTFPTEPEKFLKIYPEYLLSPEQLKAWLGTRNGAIVGKTTMKRFKWQIGQHVPLKSPIWGEPEGQQNWDFEIVGIYDGAKKGTDTTGFYFRYDYFDEARPRGKGTVGWYGVRIKDPGAAAAIAAKIDEQFANSPAETKSEAEGAFVAGFAKQLGDIGTIMVAVLSAVFFTILLVVGNTMAQAVRERTEELGVLKALGFTNRLVMLLVLLESCLIAVVGGFAGLGLSWLAALGGSPAPTVLPIFYIPGRDMLVGAGIVLALGVVSGAVPAIQASRLRIAEALRRNA
jgi:putative ABC transport system permease protein